LHPVQHLLYFPVRSPEHLEHIRHAFLLINSPIAPTSRTLHAALLKCIQTVTRQHGALRGPRDGLADRSGVGLPGAFEEIRARHGQPAGVRVAGFRPPGLGGRGSTLMSYLVGGAEVRWVAPA
jgi:hypothetical protein